MSATAFDYSATGADLGFDSDDEASLALNYKVGDADRPSKHSAFFNEPQAELFVLHLEDALLALNGKDGVEAARDYGTDDGIHGFVVSRNGATFRVKVEAVLA